MKVYIIDRLEHGNGGVYDYAILDSDLFLEEAIKKHPGDYGIYHKEFGFWPIISTSDDGENPVYYWEEDTETWELFSQHVAQSLPLASI